MTLPLTPEMLEAAYAYLRATPPFDKWKLPEPEDVKFTVSKVKGDYGAYRWDGKQHTITMSSKMVGYTSTLMKYMAHEMIHMYLEEMKWESRTGGEDTH